MFKYKNKNIHHYNIKYIHILQVKYNCINIISGINIIMTSFN